MVNTAGRFPGPPGSGSTPGRLRGRRFVIAALVVTVLVIASFASAVILGWGPFARPRAPSVSGPGVRIQVDPNSVAQITHEPLSVSGGSILVQIFSPFPSATGYAAENLSGLNATSNPYSDLLFQGTPNATGVVSGNLSARFYAIDRAWLTTMSSMTTAVSLQLSAVLSWATNGTDAVYTFSDNIPYSPRAPPAVVAGAVSFPSRPTFVVPTAASPAPGALSPSSTPPPPGGCTPSYEWLPVNSTYISDGVAPLIVANDAGAPSGAELTYGESFAQSALQLSFTSDSGYDNSSSFSGVQISKNPSWSGDDSSFQGGIYTSGAISGGHSITMIDLTGAELQITNYQYVYVDKYCKIAETYRDYWTETQLNGFSGGSNFVFGTDVLPTYFGSLVSDEKDWAMFSTQSLPWLGSGVQMYSVLINANGYNTAQNAEAQAEAALSTLSFCIGTMLLADDVLGFIPGFGDVGSTALALEALGEVTGDAAMFMTLFNSISFSMSERTSVEQVNVNVGAGGTQTNLVADFYQATMGAGLNVNGQSYNPNMPLTYVVAT